MKCGDTKEECPRFTTPEFCPVTVLLPESLDTFGISCYLHTGYNIKFIQSYRNIKKLFK